DISHIALATNADLVLIAPATANTLAKIASGMADNMITAVTLAATCPVAVAPSMNVNMYHNIATQENIATLRNRGFYIILPQSGELACGVVGDGRMKEPEDIFSDVVAIFANRLENLKKAPMIENNQERLPSPTRPLELTQTRLLPKAFGAGMKVLITAGPTQEALDPVRYISNHSSGKMGYALAHAALQMGAEVTLVSGPVNIEPPHGVRLISVKTAVEMLNAVEAFVASTDIFIGCAAVADYRAQTVSPVKIKKTGDNEEMTITLVRNPDIIATVASRESCRPFTVGFAAETNSGESYAKDKLERKKLDLIVLNDVSDKSIGFNSNDNEVTVFDRDGKVAHFDKQSKAVIAASVMELIFNAARKQ
ncbi:MAG: bifunctional phosphopantothenoylcysteine decarboxylase/phosphopantothenate--cysteine ligase CoaBC, partial [Succinivibrio sp.]